jgi:2-iminobutanoate/2-iminopropanoate deaminase
MMPSYVDSPFAPPAIGPYSHAVRVGPLLHCSGQIALDDDGAELVGDSSAEQLRRCLENLDAICRAEGATVRDAIRTGVYITEIRDYPAVNAAYAEFFGDRRPARTTLGIASLPKGALVEVDAIVLLDPAGS